METDTPGKANPKLPPSPQDGFSPSLLHPNDRNSILTFAWAESLSSSFTSHFSHHLPHIQFIRNAFPPKRPGSQPLLTMSLLPQQHTPRDRPHSLPTGLPCPCPTPTSVPNTAARATLLKRKPHFGTSPLKGPHRVPSHPGQKPNRSQQPLRVLSLHPLWPHPSTPQHLPCPPPLRSLPHGPSQCPMRPTRATRPLVL